MFSRIRRNLTLLYTLLTALALGSFALLFYFGLASVLMREQEKAVNAYAASLSHDAGETLKKYERRHAGEDKAKKTKLSRGESTYTYYLLSNDGGVAAAQEAYPEARPVFMARAGSNPPERMGILDFAGPEGGPVRFLWVKDAVLDEGRQVGVVMAGRDLAEHDHFLLRLAQTLGASSLLLLLLSGVIGHFASGRALIPIRRSFEAQRRFAADASHELRTPLSVIQASLEVVEKEDGAHFSPLSRQIFADLQDETRRMSRLTGNLLTLARYDSGAVETVRKKAGLRGIAEHVFRSLQALARTRELTLQLAMDEDLDIWADPDLITQLLFILLDNGLKFTPPGGRVSLEIQRAREEKGMVALSVSDTGIGLSAEDKERIFERFYRADQARSRETGGAGLGLSIAAWIVKAHEGYIRVEDAKGGGSVFRVLLREAEQGAARGKH